MPATRETSRRSSTSQAAPPICSPGAGAVCQWSKQVPDLPLEVTDNGQPVTFNRGRTYLAIVDEDEEGYFTFNA